MRSECDICGREKGLMPPFCGRERPNATFPDMADCYSTGFYRLKHDLAAAELRGRRRGVEEAAKWLRDDANRLRMTGAPWPMVAEFEMRAELVAALAPRDSATADDGYCKTCNSINGTHQSWCTSFKAPRDSAPAPTGDWRKERDAADDKLIAKLKAPRDSGKERP